MISVLCVRFGTKYGVDYVERLRNMVSRHLTVPYEFFCLTDDPTPIAGVKLLVQPNAKYARPWWHKVHMFDPSLGLQGRILYFDLDVIIHANIDKLVDFQDQEFRGIRDFNRKYHKDWKILNSSTMCWPAGQHSDIYNHFMADTKRAQQMHGDQDWIWQIAKNRIKFWPDEWLMSYKWEIRDRSEIQFSHPNRIFRDVRNPTIPSECVVCVFHGDPKPEDIKDPFVVDNWR
jgi:hypothetical protein